jgi:hypothetical protein
MLYPLSFKGKVKVGIGLIYRDMITCLAQLAHLL